MMSENSESKNALYYGSLLISYVFHPVFIPSYIFISFYFHGNFVFHPLGKPAQYNVVLLMIITTALIPLIMLFINTILMKKNVTRADLFMNNSKDRFVPFLYTGIFYTVLTYMLFTYLHLPVILIFYMTIISVSVLLTAFISLFWKISAHALSLGAALTIFALTYTILPDDALFYVVIVTFLISGLVLASRLYLNAHRPAQVYIGFLTGMILGACGLYFLVPNLFPISF